MNKMNCRLSRRQKRAQIIGQVFVLILGAIILFVILGYGYTMINKLLKRQQEVALAAFESDLNDAVQRIKLRFGSVERVDIPVPGKFSAICIIDSDNRVANPILQRDVRGMYKKWSEIGTNVFMVPAHEFRLEDIEVNVRVNNENLRYCCFKTEGRLTIRLEGMGRKARLEPWVEYVGNQEQVLQPCLSKPPIE